MVYVSRKVRSHPCDGRLEKAGLPLFHCGKVRHTYLVPGFPNLLLVLATDRVSIYDLVLGFFIRSKGEVLTVLTVFWHLLLQKANIDTHVVAYGSGIDEYLPETLRGDTELQKRAIVVRRLKMFPIEAIVRGYLTGSGWASYKKDGKVCGIVLPTGLTDGSKLPYQIFTPTTKAEQGHDEHLDTRDVDIRYPWMSPKAILLYGAMNREMEKRGLIMADTKFEFGIDEETGIIYLADEFGTPDSSRFWLYAAWLWAIAKLKSPSGLDKQYLRDKGAKIETPFDCTLNKLQPENQEHVEWAGDVVLDENTIKESQQRYATVAELVTGLNIEDFQREVMGITV